MAIRISRTARSMRSVSTMSRTTSPSRWNVIESG
jgi:hypothetical protein